MAWLEPFKNTNGFSRANLQWPIRSPNIQFRSHWNESSSYSKSQVPFSHWKFPSNFFIGFFQSNWNDKRNQAKTFYTSMMIVHYFVQFVLMILLLPREKFNFIPQGILLNTQRKKNIWDSAVHLARGMGKMVVVIQIVILWNVYMTMVSVMVLWAWTKYTHITIQWLLSIIYSTTSTSKYW